MTLEFQELGIPGVVLVSGGVHEDARGYFVDVYQQSAFAARSLPIEWSQQSLSQSERTHTVRGIHFQREPSLQDKLVRVVAGRVYDVVVDLRQGSPTAGDYIAIELGNPWDAVFVPAGFGHGFCTLEPRTVVQYSMSTSFDPDRYDGVNPFSPHIGIRWPVVESEAIVSGRDRALPHLNPDALPFEETAGCW